MKRLNPLNEDFLETILEKYPWVTYVGYAAGTIIVIWIVGKSAKMLTDATLNFKALHKAMKS